MGIATTPEPPYFAVIFTSIRNEEDDEYNEMGKKMVELATQQEGYLGHESAREGIGITVSYWNSLESIKKWKNNADHLIAQEKGKTYWYDSYKTRICKVEHDYEFLDV